MKELENNFRYEQTQINDTISKQLVENKFPIPNDKNCLYSVFAFVLERCNVKYSEYCEAYAAGAYHPTKMYECFTGDLDEKDLPVERSKVHVFDRKICNPVSKKID